MKKQPYSPYNNASDRFIKNTLLWSGAFTIIIMIVLRIIDQSLTTPETPNGIIGFELIKNIHHAETIMNIWGEHGRMMAALSVGIDFLYIVSYSIFLWLATFSIGKKLNGYSGILSKSGYRLSWLIFLAGTFDIIENYALIKMLNGVHNQLWATTAYYFSLLKFAIVIITLLYLILGLVMVWLTKPVKNAPVSQ